MKISFNVQHLYYLPQYLPVYNELVNRGNDCEFLLYSSSMDKNLATNLISKFTEKYSFIKSHDEALNHYHEERFDWIIFGNKFPLIDQLPEDIKTALLYHGIGVKDCYYDSDLLQTDIRFVEGPHRTREILHRNPDAKLAEVGFAKLDPLFNNDYDKYELFQKYGLDKNRKTILYAPTFYPSSLELMHYDWPVDFEDYNIIIKPHEFSLSKEKYKQQRERLLHWQTFQNVYLADKSDFSLLPFMALADLMISEASSALFEFAALNKPVIWCDFLKLRWTYRGPLRFRFEKRMDQTIKKYSDIARHVKHYRELKLAICDELHNLSNYEKQRKHYSEELLGLCDGKASQRICDALEKNLSQ